MWERFSYYGMRAFRILSMTTPLAAGGLGFDVRQAGSVHGTILLALNRPIRRLMAGVR